MGTAVIAVILQDKLDHLGPHATAAATAAAFGQTYAWVIAMSLVALIPAVFLWRIERRTRAEGIESEPSEEVRHRGAGMTTVAAATGRQTALEQVRLAMGELFGAERRLRGREQQQGRDLTHSQLRALVALDKVRGGDCWGPGQERRPQPGQRHRHAGPTRIERHRRTTTQRSRPAGVHGLAHRKGRAIVDDERARWHAQWEESLGQLSDEELEAALRVMQTMIRFLDGL